MQEFSSPKSVHQARLRAMRNANTAAIIVAAGRGSRAGAGMPKQYRALPGGTGETVLAATLRVFAEHKSISRIVTLIHKDDEALYEASVGRLQNADKVSFQIGGAERQDSVFNGLKALADNAPDRVLIHDAARPYVTAALIDACIDELDQCDAVTPALPVTDTLKRAEGDTIMGTVQRDGLYRAQTPQAFDFAKILAAHEKAAPGMTDDAAIAEAAGLKVKRIEGDAKNIKLTHEADFMTTSLLPRTGAGFDVHRFDEAGSTTQIMLGGIAIPHDRALIGHSDADVALHAITDALLGALADGDIGDHFPPSDNANKNRPSADFLTYAVALANNKHGRISHIDLTLICEKPKIGLHRDAIRAKIAALCGIETNRVSVKATTTEGLGFTGRGEGLAAQALVTLLMPGDY